MVCENCNGCDIIMLSISVRREVSLKISTNLPVSNTITGISKFHQKNEDALFDAKLVKIWYVQCANISFFLLKILKASIELQFFIYEWGFYYFFSNK